MNKTDSTAPWTALIAEHIKGDSFFTDHRDSSSNSSFQTLTIANDSGKVCISVGLMNSDHQPPVEIIFDSLQPDLALEPCVAKAACSIFKGELSIRPGAVAEGLVKKLLPELELEHLLFVPQFQWDYEMSEAELPSGTIYPLLAVPMSDMELLYLRRFSYAKLDHLWERREIDLLDWTRPSAVKQLDIDRALIRLGHTADH